MESILALSIPIFICVILPIAIVFIVCRVTMNGDNKRAEILIKAIESDNGIDTDKLAESLQKPKKTLREILNLRLLRGCIFSLVGIALVIIGIVDGFVGTQFTMEAVSFPMALGAVSAAIGISYLIVYFVTRKQLADTTPKDE